MKVLLFYRKDTEYSRAVDEFVHDLSHQYPEAEVSMIDVDTQEGSRQAVTYDVVQYPTVIAVRDDGGTLQRWDAGQLPLMNEVAFFSNQ